MLGRPVLRAAVLALAALLACDGGGRGPAPERFVPASVTAALVVPEARRAARELAELHAAVSAFPGAGGLGGARGALAAQLGFDPLDPDALADAGIDPKRGLAVALLDRRPGPKGEPVQRPVLVLPVRDAPRLEALFVRLARDRLGATERSAEARGGVSVVSLRRADAPAPSLAYAIVERTAIVCAGPHAPALVAEVATLAPSGSLAGHAGFTRARAALGDAAAVAFLPAGSPALQTLWAFRDGVAVGVAAGARRLTARLAMLLGEREPSFRALAADGRAAPLVGRLDPDAPLAARWDGDFTALGRKLVPMLGARDRARLERRGLDLDRDLFGLLAPGGAAALSLPSRLSLGGLTAEAARADPLRAFEFEVVVPLRRGVDPSAAADRLSRALGAARRGREGDGVARLQTPSGEIAWKLDASKGRLVAAGGRPGRLEALVERLDSGAPGWKAETPAAEAALSGGLGGIALDAPRLVAAVRALPDEAFGGGPSGFVMRSLVERVVEPAARLAAISLRADLVEGALVLSLDVEAGAAEER